MCKLTPAFTRFFFFVFDRLSQSSVYCFYDPDFRALALGKLTALKETEFVREVGTPAALHSTCDMFMVLNLFTSALYPKHVVPSIGLYILKDCLSACTRSVLGWLSS